MLISALNTSSTAYTFNAAPTANDRLDTQSNLYKLDLKKVNKRDLSAVADEPVLSDALVYTRTAINSAKPLSSSAVVLENADGSLFTLNTANAKVNLVARNRSIELYVYNPADNTTGQASSVLKYTFDRAGKLSTDAPVTELKPWEVSAAEISTRRDLDGNGTANGQVVTDQLGGKLAIRTGSAADRSAARQEASAGIFKLEVLDQTLFVVGDTIERSRQVNASDKTLLSSDGLSAWQPDADYEHYRAVKIAAGAANNAGGWAVYATQVTGNVREITRFEFNANRQLDTTRTAVLSDADVNTLEVGLKRDINADGFFGARIAKEVDKTGGLYEAQFQGATVYLAQAGLKSDATGANPVGFRGKLLDGLGQAWAGPGADYTLSSVVANSQLGQNDTGITVFAKKTSATDEVIKFTFSATGNGAALRYTLDNASATGTRVSAVDMAAAEKLAKRDLNTDNAFGVGGITARDSAGGLFQGSLMGNTFFMVGAGLRTASTGSLANDLSQALLAADGSAWQAQSGYTVATVVQTARIGGNVTENRYSVYAYKGSGNTADKSDVLRYDFASDSTGKNVTVTASDIQVTAQSLTEQEKALARDLNLDTQIGAIVQTGVLDIQGGLFKASVFGNDYVVKGTPGQSTADLSQAFYEDDGRTAWKPTLADGSSVALSSATLRLVMADATGNADATIYLSTGAGATLQYLKFDFEETDTGFKQVGNASVLSVEDMAAAEKANKAQSVDLNADGAYGVLLDTAIDQRGGLFKGRLGNTSDVFFKESPTLVAGSKIATSAQDFSAALKQDEAYWSIDTTGKTLRAFSDGDDYVVVVSDNSDRSKIRQYTFDTTDGNRLSQEQDISLDALIALETGNTINRDLNGDGIVGVRVSATVPDATGGLFTVNAAGTDHLVVAANAAAITDLSQALRQTDGSVWSAPAGTTRLVLDSAGSELTVYAKTASGVNAYTFDATAFTLKADKTQTGLSDVQIADAEKAADGGSGRDINGDGVVGARVTKTLDATQGLYEASMNGTTYTVVNTALSGNTTTLGDKALLLANGNAWSLVQSQGQTQSLVDAVVTVSGGSVQKTELFVKTVNGQTTTGERLTFGSDGKLLATDSLTGEAITALSASVKASFMSGSYVDTTGGLYKANVLGSDFYVVGNSGANAGAPADLSRALMVGAGPAATAWAPDSHFEIAGLVVKGNNGADGYDVYTYQTTNNQVSEVRKASWDANLTYLGTVPVDAANLVDVETRTGRDLNRDGAFGFGIATNQTAVATYKGVTAAQVGGDSMTFLLVGTQLTPGTARAPIGLKDALLNSTGNAAWTPDIGFDIKAVDDSGANRMVYASNGSGAFMQYTFSKVDGKLQGPGTALTALQMADLEVTGSKDLNSDGYVGLGSISTLRVSSSTYAQGKDTGLLQASIDGNDFLVYSPSWSAGTPIDLGNALLKADGTAWSAANSFTVQGVYERDLGNGVKQLEVYGHDSTANATQMFRFAQSVDAYGAASGAYTLMPAMVSGAATGLNTVTSTGLAQTEYTDEVDLNADGAIGYKALSTPLKVETGSTQALGKAALGNSEIYFVTTDYADALTDTTGAEVGGGALYMDSGNGLVYWSPSTLEEDISYTVKSVVANGSSVEVWALRSDSADANSTTTTGFVKFSFAQNNDNQWVLDSSAFVTDIAAPLSYDQIVANESGVTSAISGNTAEAAYLGKDINGDGVIGLQLDALVSSGLGSQIYSTTLKVDDGNGVYADTTYYLVGNNLASGTAQNPLGLDARYVLLDGTAAWTPTGTVSNWRVLDPVTAALQSATHALDDDTTTVYFNVSATGAVKV